MGLINQHCQQDHVHTSKSYPNHCRPPQYPVGCLSTDHWLQLYPVITGVINTHVQAGSDQRIQKPCKANTKAVQEVQLIRFQLVWYEDMWTWLRPSLTTGSSFPGSSIWLAVVLGNAVSQHCCQKCLRLEKSGTVLGAMRFYLLYNFPKGRPPLAIWPKHAGISTFHSMLRYTLPNQTLQDYWGSFMSLCWV